MPAESKPILKFTRLSENAFPPVKGSDKAAGFDLKSAYDYVVLPRNKALVKTDLQIELPSDSYGRVAPRSGLAVKNFIDVGDSIAQRAMERAMLGVSLKDMIRNEVIRQRTKVIDIALTGVIDEDYRGNVGVVLFNHGEEDFIVKKGDRIAQLICVKIYHPELIEADNLTETKRADGGFGSTGK